jgi:hypothetical protein
MPPERRPPSTSLVLTLGAYDLLVRRTRVTRLLFGMRG